MRIAVVTGSNKGIGFAAVKQLAEQFKGLVYLTSRDATRGLEAIEELKKDGLTNVKHHQLDIDDFESCASFCRHLETAHGGVDVLINNAGIAFKSNSTDPFGFQAEKTVRTNYFSTERFSKMIFPLLNKHARVVNVSSMLGHLSMLNGKGTEAAELRKILADPEITTEQLNTLANDFIKRAKDGTHLDAGWINSAYSVSKIFVSVMTRIQQREIDLQRPNDDILINAVHPGYVNTDMTSHRGIFTTERGAKPVVWAAIIPENNEALKGRFIWHDNSVVEFTASNLPSS